MQFCITQTNNAIYIVQLQIGIVGKKKLDIATHYRRSSHGSFFMAFMRKRKYTVDNSCSIDTFTEDIDQLHQQKYQKNTSIAEVHNLVGTCQMESSLMPLNLVHISEILPNALFTKQKFPAITLRLQDPLCKVLLITS